MSFPRYPKYKPSGVEWLGDVPEGWSTVPLKSISKLFGRIGYRGYTTADIVAEGEGAITLSPSNLPADGMTFDKCTYLSWEKYNESPEIMVHPNDVLLVKTASIGKVGIVPQVDFAMTVNPQLVIFKSITCQPKFLFYHLKTPFVQACVEVNNSGSTVPTITQQVIGNFRINLPGKAEQTAIAEFLDRETGKIDELVAEQRRLMELLKEKRQAVISHAVTKGLNPLAPMKPSGIEWLGDVPAGWEVAPLKIVASHNDDTLDEKTEPDLEILYVDISGVDAIEGIKTKEPMVYSDAPSRARRRVKHGDTIVSTVRTYLRAIAQVRNPEENLIVSTGFAVVRPRARLSPDYVGYVLSASYFIEQVIARSTGVSYPAINASDLVRIPVALPPLPEQTAIAEFLNSESAKFDTLTAEAQRAIDLLQERRTALISAAVTGQIDVRQHPRN